MNIVATIKGLVQKISAREHYNKKELHENHLNILEIVNYKENLRDQSVIGRVILRMPEEDFCKIIDIKDCKVGEYNCTCTKVMMFGSDENEGKICERFTTGAKPENCYDGNIELARGRCTASGKS